MSEGIAVQTLPQREAHVLSALQCGRSPPQIFGGSPGIAEGTVKVVRTVHDGWKVDRGDVLVAATTSPPWTILFATAGGLVTDSGGILSHSAVVAREYGLPAVVGTGCATACLRDGQRVVVDGGQGTVRIVDDATEDRG